MSTVILLGWTFGRQKALSIFKKEKTRKEKEKNREFGLYGGLGRAVLLVVIEVYCVVCLSYRVVYCLVGCRRYVRGVVAFYVYDVRTFCI